MQDRPRTLLLLLACGAAVLALVLWGSDALRARPAVEPGPAPAPAAPQAAGLETPPAPLVRSETADTDGGGAPAGDPAKLLRGVVLGPDGAPAPDVRVELRRGAADGISFFDDALRQRVELVDHARTDSRGRFAFEVPPARPFRLAACPSGLPVVQRLGCYAGHDVTLKLAPGATLHGTVTAADGGAPLAGVSVRGVRSPGRVVLFSVETDAGGRFRAAGVAPGALDVHVEHPAYTTPRSTELVLRPGATVQRDFVLDAAETVRGQVVDAATGLPIAGAEVGEGHWLGKSVRTDAAGRFALGFSGNQVYLGVRAAGYGKVDRRLRKAVRDPLPEDLVIAMTPARRARGTVYGPDRKPLAGAYVAAAASEHSNEHGQRIDWCAGETGADGTFELTGLCPELRHVLVVRSDSLGTVAYDFPDTEPTTPVVELGDVFLAAGAQLAGTVVDERGRPVPAQSVTLRGHNADRFRLGRTAENTWSVDGYACRRSMRTDARGRFAFADLAAGTYEVSTSPDGKHRPVTLSRAVVAGERVDDVQLVSPRGLQIAGTVTVGDGGPLPTCYVSVDPSNGAQTPADVEVGKDGRFSAVGLQAGAYTLTFYPYQSADDRRAGRKFASKVVEAVPAGRTDLRVELERER